MPVIKIGRRTIAAIEPLERPVTYFDNALKGFGLLVRSSGSRSWIFECRPGRTEQFWVISMTRKPQLEVKEMIPNENFNDLG